MEKVISSFGMYFGGLHPRTGKVLVIRRKGSESIIPNVSFRGNWELPGGAVMATDASSIPYNYHFRELSRILKEKTGMDIGFSGLHSTYTLMFKGAKGYDSASVVRLITEAAISIGEGKWVSPKELAVLAEEFEPADESTGKSGRGLVSGTGKRMHCLALLTLCGSPNKAYAEEARQMLNAVTGTW